MLVDSVGQRWPSQASSSGGLGGDRYGNGRSQARTGGKLERWTGPGVTERMQKF